MNILMILANPFTHDPRVYREATSLTKAGHNVTVLAWDKTGKHPKKETKNGIKIVRSYNSQLMNVLPYDIFRLHWWWRKGYKDAVKLFEENHFDVIHCHDLSSLPIGVKLKKKFGVKLVYDAHEIWGYMVSNDLPKIWAEYYLKKEKSLMKYVDHIITVNDLLKEYFKKLSKKPVTVIMNAKDLIYEKYEPPNTKKFTIKFIGTIDPSRNLLPLIDIVKDRDDIRCVIAGKGHDKDHIKLIKKRCEKTNNCEFIGRIPMSKVIPETRSADVVYCLTSAYSLDVNWPVDINLPPRFGLANKVFESMVAGRPIIVGKNTYNEIFTKKIGCGIAAENTKEDIREVILKLKNNPNLSKKMGENGFNAAREKYNWGKQEEKLVKLYENLC